MGIIKFIDLDDLFFSDVFSLSKKYGHGISIGNYFILKHCMNNALMLVTSDPAIVKIGTELKITLRSPEEYQLDIIIEEVTQRIHEFVEIKQQK